MSGADATIDQAIGQKIRWLRVAKGISGKALGRMLGISYQQLQKYESGKNRVSAASLVRIAESLDMPAAYFLDQSSGALPEGIKITKASAELVSHFQSLASADRRALIALARALARKT